MGSLLIQVCKMPHILFSLGIRSPLCLACAGLGFLVHLGISWLSAMAGEQTYPPPNLLETTCFIISPTKALSSSPHLGRFCCLFGWLHGK